MRRVHQMDFSVARLDHIGICVVEVAYRDVLPMSISVVVVARECHRQRSPLRLEARYPEAIRELQTAVDLCGRGVSWVVGALGHAYAVAGNKAEALLILEELLDPTKRAMIDFFSVALTYAGLGDIENSLTCLEKACDARGASGIPVKVDPRFDLLRSEPRFHNVLRRMNLMS